MKQFAKFGLWIYDRPGKIADFIQEKRNRARCRSHALARLHRTCRILNMSGQPDRIVIGKGSHIHGDLLVLPHGGSIEIGSYSFISEGTRIWSAASIDIGDNVLISHSVNIHDNDSHSLSAAHRRQHYRRIIASGHPADLQNVAASPIIIKDDAWIGFGAALMKGVTIGRGAVVASMSVVTKDVAPFTIVAGNPAREIGTSTP